MVSVIIPTYNSKEYIEECLNSLFKQTYKDLEIIVVDDGSTDGTEELLKKYEKEIIYIKKTNGGESSAKNKGLNVARGEYIAFLDADDLYKPNKISEQVEILKNDSTVDIVYNDIEVVDENLNYMRTLKSEGVYESRENFLCMLLVRQIVPGPASIMLRRKCIEHGIRYPENYINAEDYKFIIELASKYKFQYIPKTLYIYRRHEGNLTNNHQNQVMCEVDIIKNLGIEKIESIVYNSTFIEDEKQFIFAKILIKINEWYLAKKILENLSEKYCENQSVWFYLGNCNYILEEYSRALACYSNVVELDDSMAEAFNNLGCVYVKIKDKDKAIKNFKTALSLRKEYMDADENLKLLNQNYENLEFKLTFRELRKVLTKYVDIRERYVRG